MTVRGRADTDGLKEAVIDLLYTHWCQCHHLRLGQLLVCAVGDADLFQVEDFRMVELTEALAKRNAK